MELSNDLIKIIFLLFPGIVSMTLLEMMITHKKIDFNRYMLNIIVLSIMSYSILYWLSNFYHVMCDSQGQKPTFVLMDFLLSNNYLSTLTLLKATVIGIVMSLMLSFAINRKYINKLGQKLRITKKYGDESVWNYFHNKDESRWVTIRDKINDLMYVGWIEVFSEDNLEYDELVLRDVVVYKNSTAEKQYTVDEIYICRKREELSIEIFNYEEV
jgi:hypothetical protein